MVGDTPHPRILSKYLFNDLVQIYHIHYVILLDDELYSKYRHRCTCKWNDVFDFIIIIYDFCTVFTNVVESQLKVYHKTVEVFIIII